MIRAAEGQEPSKDLISGLERLVVREFRNVGTMHFQEAMEVFRKAEIGEVFKIYYMESDLLEALEMIQQEYFLEGNRLDIGLSRELDQEGFNGFFYWKKGLSPLQGEERSESERLRIQREEMKEKAAETFTQLLSPVVDPVKVFVGRIRTHFSEALDHAKAVNNSRRQARDNGSGK